MFAVILPGVWEMLGLHMVPNLVPAHVAELKAHPTLPFGLSNFFHTEGIEILWLFDIYVVSIHRWFGVIGCSYNKCPYHDFVTAQRNQI